MIHALDVAVIEVRVSRERETDILRDAHSLWRRVIISIQMGLGSDGCVGQNGLMMLHKLEVVHSGGNLYELFITSGRMSSHLEHDRCTHEPDCWNPTEARDGVIQGLRPSSGN